MKAKLKKVAIVLASPQARPSELILLRLIVAALGIRLGVNLVDYLNL